MKLEEKKVGKVLLAPNDGLHTSLLSFEVTIRGAGFATIFSVFGMVFGAKVGGNGLSRTLTLVLLAGATGVSRHLVIKKE